MSSFSNETVMMVVDSTEFSQLKEQIKGLKEELASVKTAQQATLEDHVTALKQQFEQEMASLKAVFQAQIDNLQSNHQQLETLYMELLRKSNINLPLSPQSNGLLHKQNQEIFNLNMRTDAINNTLQDVLTRNETISVQDFKELQESIATIKERSNNFMRNLAKLGNPN